MDLPIQYDPERLKAFCEKWQIAEFSLFGSVLRDDFRPDSDVDVLVSFKPQYHSPSFSDILVMTDELEALFNRKIDLVNKPVIAGSRNFVRRKEILNSAKVIYVNA